jgi:ABC-type Na+ transport system ATPase subunit NatA
MYYGTECDCYSLTVEEHLLFYGQLKGLSRKEIMKQIPE